MTSESQQLTASPLGRLTALCLAVLLWGCEGFIAAPLDKQTEASEFCIETREAELPVARLLTRFEYAATVEDLFNLDNVDTSNFPSENEVGGFNNNAKTHKATQAYVEAASKEAQVIAAELERRGIDKTLKCELSSPSECAQEFISIFGPQIYRRPLTEIETSALYRVYTSLELLGYDAAISAVVEAMLSSPGFLYRVEAPFEEQALPEANMVDLGSYELASRLSYFLWGSLPDAELFAAAQEDTLKSLDELERQARRMLQNPRATARIRDFHYHWLGLNQFVTAARDGAPEGAQKDWQAAILDFMGAPYQSAGELATQAVLFRGQAEALPSSLESLYDGSEVYDERTSEEAEGGAGSQALFSLGGGTLAPEDKAAGILTHPGLMALLSLTNQSSPIRRGVYVRERLLCDPIAPPPPEVNTNPPDPAPGLTTRERFKVHTEDPNCASCHQSIDPAGFLFEHFDHLGRYREQEQGLTIDSSGEIFRPPGAELQGALRGAEDLGEKMETSDTFLQCLSSQWFAFSLGRSVEESDRCAMTALQTQVKSKGRELPEILIELIKSSSFRKRRGYEPKDLP